MRRALVCAVAAVIACGPGAAHVDAARPDRAAARVFLIDATRYARSAVVHHLQLKAAARAFIEHVVSSCPGVLAQAPPAIVEHVAGAPPWREESDVTPAQRTTSQTFLTMALGELKLAGLAPLRAPALAFANRLARLRWRNPGLSRVFDELRQSILATLALRPPDLCVDARASAATGFGAAPAEASQFVDAFRAASLVGAGRSLSELASLAAGSLARRDLGALARFRRLWARAEPALTIGDRSAFRLLRVVFLPRP